MVSVDIQFVNKQLLIESALHSLILRTGPCSLVAYRTSALIVLLHTNQVVGPVTVKEAPMVML